MIFDIIICLLLIAILYVVIEFGKTVSYYGYLLHNVAPTLALTVRAIIQYIKEKLKRFIEFIKRIFNIQKYQQLDLKHQELEALIYQLKISTQEV